MLGPEYLLKLYCENNKKLQRLKDTTKSFDQQLVDEEKYAELIAKHIYLDLTCLEDRIELHSRVSQAAKHSHPVEKDFYAVRLQRLIKGKRSK
jgi:hypothetical protein